MINSSIDKSSLKWWQKYIDEFREENGSKEIYDQKYYEKKRLEAQENLPILSEDELVNQASDIRNMDSEDAQLEALNNIICNKGCSEKVLDAVYEVGEDVLTNVIDKNELYVALAWHPEYSTQLHNKVGSHLPTSVMAQHPFSSEQDLSAAIKYADDQNPPQEWVHVSKREYDYSEEVLCHSKLSERNLCELAKTARLPQKLSEKLLNDVNCSEEFRAAAFEGRLYLIEQGVYLERQNDVWEYYKELDNDDKLYELQEIINDEDLPTDKLKKIFDITKDLKKEGLDEELKNSILDSICTHPNCSKELNEEVFYAYSDLSEEEFSQRASKIMQKNPSPKIASYIKDKIFENYMSKFVIDMAYGRAGDTKISAFIKKLHQVVINGDEKKIEKLKNLLFSKGKNTIFAIDHQAVKWFIKEGTPEKLEALNSLRGLYGLKTIVEPFSHDDSDIVDIKRIQFSGQYNAMSVKWINPETDEQSNNPHYTRKHTERYLKCKRIDKEELKSLATSMKQKIKHSEAYLSAFPNYTLPLTDSESDEYFLRLTYDLNENEAYKKMKAAGVAIPENKLKEALVAHRYRPEDVKEFNVTDLQQIYVEYVKDVDPERGSSAEAYIDYRSDYSTREQFWYKVAENEELKQFISNDLRKKGISERNICQIWNNCEKYGSPCFIAPRHEDNVYGVSLQVHHRVALKDGGKNELSNFMIVVDVRAATQIIDYDGDIMERDGGNYDINSHAPLHEHDNPLVYIYQDNDGKIRASNQEKKEAQRMKVLTYPLATGEKGENVLYYGGPDAESCCVGKLDGHVHGIEYKLVNTDTAQKTEIKTNNNNGRS